MPVTESLMAVGQWSLTLSPNTPRSIIDSLAYFQHIVISTGRSDPRVAGNSLFSSGRYTGVITGLDFQSLKAGRGPVISGDGMATWLGTPKGVGPVIENQVNFVTAGIATVVNTLRPSSVGAGTIYGILGGSYTGGFVWKTPRDALTSFAQQVSTGPLPTQIAEWRVNGDCTLDFGPVASLYRTTPVCAIVPKSPGVDMSVRGLDGVAQMIEDVKDLTTRVVVLASGTGAATAVGTANASDVGASIPYTDFFGNPVKMTRMVSASSVSAYNATAAAQSALIPYVSPADQVRLSSSEYDIKGDLQVGDYVWLYDPDAGFTDSANELVFRGQRINPTKQRLIEATWPVVEGMSVAYRDQNGTWHDLTDYVVWETGTTNLVVGGYNRNLIPTSEPVGPRPQPDTTIPGIPAFNTPFATTTYQSSSDGATKAQIQLTWTTPANTDGTTMTDLDHYEIQYRPDLTISSVNPTWNGLNLGGYTWAQLQSIGSEWSQIYPIGTTDWKVTFVAGGVNQLLVQELTPGVTYDFQIRAVDTAQPPNRGAWSSTTTFQAAVDTTPPPTPDAPSVAANMASVQISWDCGRASGGTYNQASDLHHIEVHGSYDPLFQPSASTKLGNLPASVANITGQIPVVGSFTIPPGQPPAQAMFVKVIAVDISGNKSSPSASAGASAVLWSNAYITDLSVSKLTAGTITADVVVGGVIATALTGVRAGMDPTGLWCYDASGDQTFLADATTGHVELSSSGSGQRVAIRTGVNLSAYAAPASADAIILYPDGATLNPPVLASYDLSAGGSALSAFSGIVSDTVFGHSSTYAYVMSLQGSTSGNGNALLAYIDVGTNAFNGGAVQVASTFAFVGLANEGSIAGGSIYQVNGGLSTSDVSVDTVGYTFDRGGSAPSSTDLTFGGRITGLGGGLSGLAWSYGVTLNSTPYPICQYSCGTTSTIPATDLSAFSTTGFTLSLSAATPATWSVLFTATRVR